VNLRFTAAEEAFRAEARAWLEAHVPKEPLPSGDTREGFAKVREFERALFEGGWAVVSWPKEYGGREASLVEWLIFEEEYYRAGAPPRVTQNGIFLLAPTLFEFGTDEQKARILRPMAAAEVMWAQAWSEPNAGSDLASLKSRAVPAAGGWKLTGQKTWCTRGAFCDWIYGLFRTDPDQSRHRGITYFMIPLDAPGVTVRPVERLDGDEGFAEVFLDEGLRALSATSSAAVNQGWNGRHGHHVAPSAA
jgi:alkylation response protein AidB-like acyl-CoA dehydrogenase